MHTAKFTNIKDLLGKAVERTPQIEQVNLNGGRLLREAKVRIPIQ